jgi:ATP-dependent RNA helicase RhlE
MPLKARVFILNPPYRYLLTNTALNTQHAFLKEFSFMAFSTLGLCDALLKTIEQQGYTAPSPIQTDAIPAVLSGRDVMALAHTGTGKTASFTLPLLQLLATGISAQPGHVRALVIAPTRELAAQVAQSVENYSANMNIRSTAAFGGVRIEPQIFALEYGADVLVATPGRLLDLHNKQALNFEHLEILVLDEADRMLDLGFIDDILRIQALLPNKRQTLMFSATFSKEIKMLAKSMLFNPVVLEMADATRSLDNIKQQLHPVDKARKTDLLIHLLVQHKWPQALVFCRTKRGADEIVTKLESLGINADSIHANRTQRARTLALDGFKNGTISVLIATDIASRGIDISHLPCVINHDLPFVPQDYVHRIGRTGRANATGLAITLFSEDETEQLRAIEAVVGHTFAPEIVIGFVPTNITPTKSAIDEPEYGNFEADTTPRRFRKSTANKKRKK